MAKYDRGARELRDKWQKIIKRCEVPTDDHYRYYGARGVTVCAAWHDFDVFSAWAFGAGWVPGSRLVRRDTSGPFAPENCTIEAATIQAGPVLRAGLASALVASAPALVVGGVSLSLRRWADVLGMAPGMLAARIVAAEMDAAGVVSGLLRECCGVGS